MFGTGIGIAAFDTGSRTTAWGATRPMVSKRNCSALTLPGRPNLIASAGRERSPRGSGPQYATEAPGAGPGSSVNR